MKKNVLFRLKKHNFILKAAALAAASVFIFSCRSVPMQAEKEDLAGLLPESSDVIIRADIKNNLELIQPVLDQFKEQVPDNFADEFIQRSDTVWAGLDIQKADDSESSLLEVKNSIAVQGDYPKGMINWGLCWDKNWKKSGDAFKYWNEKDGQMQVAVPTDKLFIASSGSIEEMVMQLYQPEPRLVFTDLPGTAKDADVFIAAYGLQPEDYGSFVPELERVPLKTIYLQLDREEDLYNISGRFEMDSEMSAFLMAAIFRTMIISAKDEAGARLFPNPREIVIKMDGSYVVLSGMRLGVETVAATEQKWLLAAGIR